MIVAGGQTNGGGWLDTIEKFDFGNPGAGWTYLLGRLPFKMGQPGSSQSILTFEQSNMYFITGYSQETGYSRTIWTEYNQGTEAFHDFNTQLNEYRV